MNSMKPTNKEDIYSFTANAKIIDKETSMEVEVEAFKNDSMHTIYQRIDSSTERSIDIRSEIEDEYNMNALSSYMDNDEADYYGSHFENQMATPISKIDFVKEKSEKFDKFSQLVGEIENINLENVTPSNRRTHASSFISPYTSQLLQKQTNPLSNSKEIGAYEDGEEEQEQEQFLSTNFSLGPLTKSKIKSLMRDETNPNITPEDGIIGANTVSYMGESDMMQENWKMMGRDTTDNDYILRRTSTNFYCNQESSCNMSSVGYEESFATFINICEQKVKKMVRLDIEKKINLIQMRANFPVSKDKRAMLMWRDDERRDAGAVVDEKLRLPVFCRSKKTKIKGPMRVFSRNAVKRLKRGERSSKCLSKISMYGFKKPAQIFTSFTKRRGFCAKCVEDGPSPTDKFLNLRKEYNSGRSDFFDTDKSAKKVKSKLACEKQKKKLVKFLKDNSPASLVSVGNETISYNSSFKSNFNCFLKGNYKSVRNDESSADLSQRSHNFKFSQLFDSTDKVKMNYKSVTQKSKDMEIEERLAELERLESSKASPRIKAGISPNLSNIENDNKKARNHEKENKNFFNSVVNRKQQPKSKRLYKVQSSMLISAKKLATRIKNNCNRPSSKSKQLSRYSSSRTLQKNNLGNSSYLKFTRSKRNFLERDQAKKTSKGRNCSRKLRRSSFLQSIETIGVEKGMKNLTCSIRRLEKSLSKSPELSKEGIKKKNSNGNIRKHKIKALKNLRFSKTQKNSNGFISSRDPRNNSCYQIMQCDSKILDDTIGKENMPNLSFRRKIMAESSIARHVSPKKFSIRNYFDNNSKNGQVFVGDRYVSVKDIVKNHITDSGVYGKKYQKRNSSNLLEKISKLKSFRKE